jgi:hypothetical protein
MPDKSETSLQVMLGKSIAAAEAKTPGPRPMVAPTITSTTQTGVKTVSVTHDATSKRPTSYK